MSIDPFADDLMPLSQAARSLPKLRDGRPVSPATLWRWSAHGLRGVKLAIVRVGGTACTSREALRRFFAEVEAARNPEAPEESASATPAQSRASRAADELSALGI
jgi:hypothetical protein